MLTTNSKNTNIPSDISSPTMDPNSPAESGNATTAGSQASAEVTDLGDDDFGPIKKRKKGGKLAISPATPKDEPEEEEEETVSRVKTKKEKEKERKKERKRQRKKKEQAARKKAKEPMEKATEQATGLPRSSTPSSVSPPPPGEPDESRIITREEFMVLFRDMRKRWLERMVALVWEFGELDDPVLQGAAERFTSDWAAVCKKDEEFWATVGPFTFLKDGEANEECEGFITETQAKTLLRFKEEKLEEKLAVFRQSVRPRFKAMA